VRACALKGPIWWRWSYSKAAVLAWPKARQGGRAMRGASSGRQRGFLLPVCVSRGAQALAPCTLIYQCLSPTCRLAIGGHSPRPPLAGGRLLQSIALALRSRPQRHASQLPVGAAQDRNDPGAACGALRRPAALGGERNISEGIRAARPLRPEAGSRAPRPHGN